jgi:hypothetical protein
MSYIVQGGVYSTKIGDKICRYEIVPSNVLNNVQWNARSPTEYEQKHRRFASNSFSEENDLEKSITKATSFCLVTSAKKTASRTRAASSHCRSLEL